MPITADDTGSSLPSYWRLCKAHKGWAPAEIVEGMPDVLALLTRSSAQTLLSYEETGPDVTFQRDLQVSGYCARRGIDWQEFQTNGIRESAETAVNAAGTE